MFLSRGRMAWRGSTGSRINRQVFHRSKRHFDRPEKSGTSNVVGSINLVRGGPNGWRPEWFEEDAQFHAGLAEVSIAFRSIKLNKTNRALMTGSDPLRKLEFDPVVRRHGDPATAGGIGAQIYIPLNCIGHAGGFGKAPFGRCLTKLRIGQLRVLGGLDDPVARERAKWKINAAGFADLDIPAEAWVHGGHSVGPANKHKARQMVGWDKALESPIQLAGFTITPPILRGPDDKLA